MGNRLLYFTLVAAITLFAFVSGNLFLSSNPLSIKFGYVMQCKILSENSIYSPWKHNCMEMYNAFEITII